MNETVAPPPTVSSRLLIGCRSRLSPGSLAAIGPSVSSPSLAWLHSEVGEGLDAGMLSNIWHVPTPPSPPLWFHLLLQTAACGGFNSGAPPGCSSLCRSVWGRWGWNMKDFFICSWEALVPLSYRCVFLSFLVTVTGPIRIFNPFTVRGCILTTRSRFYCVFAVNHFNVLIQLWLC